MDNREKKKTCVLLGCEMGDKNRKYINNLKVIVIGTRKCDCAFNLWNNPIVHEEGWVLKLICGEYNHELSVLDMHIRDLIEEAEGKCDRWWCCLWQLYSLESV